MPLCNTLKNIDLEQARYHPEAIYIYIHINHIKPLLVAIKNVAVPI